MAKKRKEPLERWSPPAETFANATKKTGNSGVTYSYEQPKRNSRTVDDVPNIRALGAGDTSASRRTQPASAKTPGQSALSGVETLFAAQKALQENGASGGGGGRVDTTSKKNKRSSFSELMARIGEASRPIGSVISEAKPGESATRAGEVMPSALKSSASGVLDTLSFLLGEAQAAQDRTRTMNRDIAAAHGFAKREDNADEDTKGESWLTRASDALSQEAGRLSEEAAGHEEAAKDGLGKVGQLLVDVGIGGTQLAADAAFGSMTGTGMLPIGVRTFGSGTRKALDAGATRGQAAAYGVGSAALEMLTEKMFDVGKVFGGGAADDLIEKAIEKWAKSPAGARAIRTFFGVLTESGEEAASELVDPIVSLFYDSDAVRETYGTAEGRQQLWQNVKHASTVGGILGGFGTVVNGNRAAEAQQRARQAAEALARRAEAEEQTRRQRAFFAPNDMQTGTADAEAAAALERNRARANRPQTTKALSRVFNGEQISEAETAAILSDPELMEQMLTATGTPVQDGDVRGAFLRMMEQNGTPLIQTAQEAAESPVTPAETQEGNLPGDAESSAVQDDSGQIREDAPKTDAQVMREAAGIQTFEDLDTAEGTTPGTASGPHIDSRTQEDLRSRKVKAFQHEHPELHEHFVTVAQALQEAAAGSLQTQMPGFRGGTNAEYTPELTRVMEETGLSRPKLIAVLQDIINDQGSENYADAKRVEKALDGLLTNGKYRDEAYLEKKGRIEGGTDPNSWEYALEHEYGTLIALGEMTEEEARAEWEARQEPVTRQNDTNLPEGHGAMSAVFPYQEAPSQTNSADSLFTDEERQNVEGLRPEDLEHQVRTNADVDYHAQERLESDYEGEKEDLYRDEKEWDVVDIATAWQILAQETRSARESGDWSEVVRLRKIYRDKASNWGQVGHEMSRHANTAEDIISEAAETLTDAGNLTPDEIRDTMEQITNFATEWQNMQQGQNEELLDLIRTMNAARRTGGLFTPGRTGNTLNRTLEAVLQQEGGFDYLWQVAGQQIRNFATDRAPMSPIEAAKSIRYMSMLSKLTTVMRNLVGNNVFDPIESMSGNVATLPDMLMSLVTHRRTTAADASWFSRAKRRGSVQAMQRAYIAAALDADPENGENRWEQRNGRTFKMAGNPLSRFLSTMEKWQQYALTVTDEFQKGGIEAEAERQRQSLIDSGRLETGELEGWAEETARQRTFQNDGAVSNLMLGARNLLNGGEDGRLTIRDSRGGSFGLGDALIPFARVPGNVVGQFLNYTPAGLAHGIGEMANVLIHAQNGTITAEQQAQAARDIGRGLNGTVMLAGLAALAAKGLLNVADGGGSDDEKDLAKLEQSEGVTGTQWNLSATLRWLHGEDAYWEDGDNLLSIGFLEPINGLMALGALLAESAEDDGQISLKEGLNSTAEAAFQAIADLPAMSSLNNIVNNFKYAQGGTGEKIGMAAAQLAGDTVSSFVPNALTGIAQGMDEGMVRQTYGSDREGLAGVAEETLNAIKGKIPVLRSTLPAALDNFGQERQTTASPLQNWFNSNLLPGAVTQYSTDRVNDEVERLAEEGAKVPDRSAEKNFTQNGQKYELDNSQQRAYQRTYGQTAHDGVQVLLQSAEYLNMSRSERVAAMDAVMDYARQTARKSVFPNYEMESTAAKAQQAAADAQIDPVQYLLIASTYGKYDSDGNGSLKQSEVEAALAETDLDDWQKAALWQLYNSKWSAKNNPFQ